VGDPKRSNFKDIVLMVAIIKKCEPPWTNPKSAENIVEKSDTMRPYADPPTCVNGDFAVYIPCSLRIRFG
jgi:hypothetical protein